MASARRVVAQRAKAFVRAAPGERSEDALMDVVRQSPEAAVPFLTSLTTCSLGSAITVLGYVCVCLAVHLGRWHGADRPLRAWLLGHALLLALQLPARFSMLLGLWRVEQNVSFLELEELVESVTAAPAWRVAGRTARVQYAWLLIGAIWSWRAHRAPGAESLVVVIVTIVAFSALRAVVMVVAAKCLGGHLTPPADTDDQLEAEALKPADVRLVDALPQVVFQRAASESGDFCTNCAVCLCDFNDGETVTRLPCGHRFHHSCVQAWLRRSNRCPLCVRAIDS